MSKSCCQRPGQGASGKQRLARGKGTQRTAGFLAEETLTHECQYTLLKGKLYSHRLCYGNTKQQVTQAAWKTTHVPREGGSAGQETLGDWNAHCTVEWLMPQHPGVTEGLQKGSARSSRTTYSRNMGEQPPYKQCPFLLPIPTPCCRSTSAQAPVSGVGGYIYFEIFHLMLFDHPELLFYELNQSFSSSVLPRWRRFQNYSLIHSTKCSSSMLICIQHQCQDMQIYTPQSLVLCVHSTPTKKKKIKQETGGFHLLLKNMNRNSIPVYFAKYL